MSLRYWLDPLGEITRLVREWRPRKCKTEKDFENSLVRHLRSNLPGKDVVPQYASGRVKGDIVIEKKYLIEIKLNLGSTSKLQRLIGQLEGYEQEWKNPIILVLCGDHDTNLLKQLKEAVNRRNDKDLLPAEPRITLVSK